LLKGVLLDIIYQQSYNAIASSGCSYPS